MGQSSKMNVGVGIVVGLVSGWVLRGATTPQPETRDVEARVAPASVVAIAPPCPECPRCEEAAAAPAKPKPEKDGDDDAEGAGLPYSSWELEVAGRMSRAEAEKHWTELFPEAQAAGELFVECSQYPCMAVIRESANRLEDGREVDVVRRNGTAGGPPVVASSSFKGFSVYYEQFQSKNEDARKRAVDESDARASALLHEARAQEGRVGEMTFTPYAERPATDAAAAE